MSSVPVNISLGSGGLSAGRRGEWGYGRGERKAGEEKGKEEGGERKGSHVVIAREN